MKLGFTGTTTLNPEGRLVVRRRVEALNITHPELTEFTTGGAVGVDTYLAGILRMLWPEALHRLVLPKTFGNPALVDVFVSGIAAGKNWDVIYTEMTPLDRNHVILEHADYLCAFPKTETEEVRSGTWATIRYARKLEIPIDITPVGKKEEKPKQKREQSPAYGRSGSSSTW